MRGPHNIVRLVRTLATLERTGAMGVVLEAFRAPPRLRVVARVLGWPFKWLGLKGDPALPPATRALTALGPAYIKFGQILSTRPDVVGEDLALQLKYLQDKLPPFPVDVAKRTVAEELEVPVEQVFSEFSEPVAAASIAQVHKARLAEDGREVAVKVLRPGIERAFRKDIDAFYLAAGVIEALAPAARRLRPMDVVTHFEGVVMGELDLRLESSAAAEFAANTATDPGFAVPRTVWFLSGRRVMTLDWVDGISMADNAAIDAAGHDRQLLGARVLTLFLNHALRDGYFHADMHQGNLKVRADGAIVAYDFGIMGRIDEYTRRVYAEILFGFIRKDYRRVAEVHFEAGYVPADRDIDEFARALRSVGEPIFGMDASRISMARLLAYLFEVTERFGMETRTELILLQRTMVVVEGVARGPT
jgi:ubiquinone biosynthesis protein